MFSKLESYLDCRSIEKANKGPIVQDVLRRVHLAIERCFPRYTSADVVILESDLSVPGADNPHRQEITIYKEAFGHYFIAPDMDSPDCLELMINKRTGKFHLMRDGKHVRIYQIPALLHAMILPKAEDRPILLYGMDPQSKKPSTALWARNIEGKDASEQPKKISTAMWARNLASKDNSQDQPKKPIVRGPIPRI